MCARVGARACTCLHLYLYMRVRVRVRVRVCRVSGIHLVVLTAPVLYIVSDDSGNLI